MSDSEDMVNVGPEQGEAEPQYEGDSTQEVEEVPAITLDEAFDRASSALSQREEERAQEPEQEREEQPAQEQEGAAQQQRARERSIESELDRIITHIQKGSLDALPPEIKGRVGAIQRMLAEQDAQRRAQEEQAKKEFLRLEALRVDDPDEFFRVMFEDENAAKNRQFYEAAKQVFGPELSGEEPTFSPEQVREQALVDVFSDMLSAIQSATNLSSEEMDALRQKAPTPWEFLKAAIQATVARETEKMRKTIAEEEAKAARAQMQAETLPNNVVVPRSVPSYVSSTSSGGPLDLRTAAEIAERMLSR